VNASRDCARICFCLGFGRGFRRRAGHLVDEFADLAFRQRAHETVDRLAAGKGDHGRDRLNAHLARDSRVIIDVELDQLDPAPASCTAFSMIGVSCLQGRTTAPRNRPAP
jgi:hypothetical protein